MLEFINISTESISWIQCWLHFEKYVRIGHVSCRGKLVFCMETIWKVLGMLFVLPAYMALDIGSLPETFSTACYSANNFLPFVYHSCVPIKHALVWKLTIAHRAGNRLRRSLFCTSSFGARRWRLNRRCKFSRSFRSNRSKPSYRMYFPRFEKGVVIWSGTRFRWRFNSSACYSQFGFPVLLAVSWLVTHVGKTLECPCNLRKTGLYSASDYNWSDCQGDRQLDSGNKIALAQRVCKVCSTGCSALCTFSTLRTSSKRRSATRYVRC